MFGKAGKIVVADVLRYAFPGRLAVIVDGDGSESGECNVLDQVQTDSWTVCDAESCGLRVAQVTPSTEIRKCANGICAEDVCGRWIVTGGWHDLWPITEVRVGTGVFLLAERWRGQPNNEQKREGLFVEQVCTRGKRPRKWILPLQEKAGQP